MKNNAASRKNFYVGTHQKVDDFFEKNKGKEFMITELVNTLHVDFYSLKLILKALQKNGKLICVYKKYMRKGG
jgi:hypothetical protein